MKKTMKVQVISEGQLRITVITVTHSARSSRR